MTIFQKADILLPDGIDPSIFSVVACDQYTSEPKYWNEVQTLVAGQISAYHMIFPEIYLKTADFDQKIQSINQSMQQYLSSGSYKKYTNACFYLERQLKNGKIRKGLIGMADLETYAFLPGSETPIRATEGTVLERIPPRVIIRENAPLELPHVMLLIDDPDRKIIEPIEARKKELQEVYSFPLMQDSGHVSGYLLDEAEYNRVLHETAQLADPGYFSAKYGITGKAPLVYAVGDGNHSLATAKQCYMNLKEKLGDQALGHPARYALVEVCNLHDESLEFEAIHRVVFHVDPAAVLDAFHKFFCASQTPAPGAHFVQIVIGKQLYPLYLNNPDCQLSAGSIQSFLGTYLAAHAQAEVDYIHGEDIVKSLCLKENTIGFLLPCMDKEDLFKTVILDGALPRKTFSMGEARDKRFYLEARKISG